MNIPHRDALDGVRGGDADEERYPDAERVAQRA
jgi:hypothetical protein